MSTWTGALPTVPVTVAAPPVPGVSVGPAASDVFVVPEDWMHLVPEFSPARFTTAVTLAAATGAGALPAFEGDVVLGAMIMARTDLIAAATVAATASGMVMLPVEAFALCTGALTATASPEASGNFVGAGSLAAMTLPEGTIAATFGGEGFLEAAVDRAGFAAHFRTEAALSALVSQGDSATSNFAATGTLAANVLVLFVRTATYTAAAQLTSAQAVQPQDGQAAGAALTAITRATTITTAKAAATVVLAAAVEWMLNFTASSATKTGNYQNTSGWAVVPNWAADTAGHPGSQVVAHKLLAEGGKPNATVTAIVGTSSFYGYTVEVRLMVAGVSRATKSGGSADHVLTWTGPIEDGDAVWLESRQPSFASSYSTYVDAGGRITIS